MAQGIFPAGALTPAPGGLFEAATVSTGDKYWDGGPFGWDTDACPVELVKTDVCGLPNECVIAQSELKSNAGWPFGIVAKYVCPSIGYTMDERRARVLRQIEAGSQKAVEHELWTGSARIAADRDLDTAQILSFGGAELASTDIVSGIASLEHALGACGLGVQGVIHMTRAAAVYALSKQLLVRDGKKLMTGLGTPVVSGVGYLDSVDHDTSPPAGQSDCPAIPAVENFKTDQWMYATGPVYVHLSPVQYLDEILDRATNTVSVAAIRAAAVYFDSCCHFGTKVTLS